MNIWLPIITNIIIAALLVCGVFVGKKNGWVSQLVKLVVSCGAGVGIYFLSPVLTNFLCRIPFMTKIVTDAIMYSALNSLIYVLLFVIVYALVSLVMRLIRKHKKREDKVKKVKVKKVKSKRVRKTKEERRLARENRRLIRKQKREEAKQKEKQKSKVDKIVGAILGFVMALIIGFVVFMPIKYCFKSLDKALQLDQITTGYEYTPYGQLDNLTDIVDQINHYTGE